MKKIVTILSITLLFAACGGGANQSSTEIPEDLDGKKALLKSKKAELRALKDEIASLEAEIDELDPAAKEQKRVVVTTSDVPKENFTRYIDIQGTVTSDKTVNVSSETGGRIIKLNFEEGDNIRKGQLVATLDLENLQKQMDEVNKSLELAKEVYERQQRLWDQNIGSEIQLLQAKNNKERLEQTLETLKFQMTKANVYAPASGMVLSKMAKSGEVVSPGMPMITIMDLSTVKVVADIPENYLKTVRKGDLVTVNFPALEMERQGRISLIGSMINPANRTFQVEVKLSNGNRQLKPNLLAVMQIKDYESKDAVVLPSELIQQEVSGRSFVFIKETNDGGDFAKKVYVETGETTEGKTEILSGLTGEEELIVEGARLLAANQLIKIANN